jgi:hypothetical protein
MEEDLSGPGRKELAFSMETVVMCGEDCRYLRIIEYELEIVKRIWKLLQIGST